MPVSEIHGPDAEHPKGWDEPISDEEQQRRIKAYGSKGAMWSFSETPMSAEEAAPYRRNMREQNARIAASQAASSQESGGNFISRWFHDRRGD